MAVHPIAAYREAHGLTPAQFAKKIGAFRESASGARVTIARYESGARQPSINTARRIAKKTGIPLLALRPDLADVVREAAT